MRKKNPRQFGNVVNEITDWQIFIISFSSPIIDAIILPDDQYSYVMALPLALANGTLPAMVQAEAW